MPVWQVAPEWAGQTAWIIAGGPSARAHNIENLRGRRVIVINSSVHAAPWADILIFADKRWLNVAENKAAVAAFPGLVVTTDATLRVPAKNVRFMLKASPPSVPRDPRMLTIQRTTLTGAIHLAYHLGSRTAILLGADGKAAADGATCHHKEHPWKRNPHSWLAQKKELEGVSKAFQALGITVLNASPGSAFTCWPIVDFEDSLCRYPL